MARSTYGVYLMKGTGTDAATTYTKLVDIKEFPDLGGTPEPLDTTTLSDNMRTGIPGIIELDTLEFTANYDKAKYLELKELEGKDNAYAIYMDKSPTPGGTPTGDDGIITFKGVLTVYITGGGVNEVVDMNISVTASTPLTMKAD